MSDTYCVGAPSSGEGLVTPIADDDEFARVLRALAHPARLKLVRLLAAHGSCSGSEVFSAIDLAQSTISEHLRVLGEAGLVTSTPSGAKSCYCLATERLIAVREALHALDEA